MAKRLFIAADIDETTRGQVGRISGALRRALEGQARASWVQPGRMHLTLQFAGHADSVLEERMLLALAEPIDEPPFDLSFEGIGFFPDTGSPRVLWLGIRDGTGPLARVQEALTRRITGDGGPQTEAGRFRPHLTLARFRDRVSRQKLGVSEGFAASAGPCRIDRVTLYESRLSSEGPTYLRLAEAPLICPTARSSF